MISKEFVTAGRAIFTVEMPEGSGKPHYTYRIKSSKPNDRYPNPTWFVQLLTGPDNTKDYSYLGILDPNTGTVRTTAKSKFNSDSYPVRLVSRVIDRVWANDVQSIFNAGFALHHEGRCGRCGRKLTVPESVKSGIGPECAGKL
jgi:hypothetical protein